MAMGALLSAMIRHRLVAALTTGIVCCSFAAAGRAQTVEWTRQLGSSKGTHGEAISADGLGNVYISGYTLGNLNGPGGLTIYDAFVSKYDAKGDIQWTRQIGNSTHDLDASYGVSADGLGNVYICGYTFGTLSGTYAGNGDAFVSKYDAAGNLQWTRQFGTNMSEVARGVSADGLGSVYLSGHSNGNLSDMSGGIPDAFVRKYDAAGTFQWSRELSTAERDASHGVSADGLGNVYITGRTEGSLSGPNAGISDAFVSKYDAAGTLQWTRQIGTSDYDAGNGVSADGLGNVYITGRTDGSLDALNAGLGDAFISKFDASGSFLWTRQLGTSAFDIGNSVSADGFGSVYITGHTDGNLGALNAGLRDAFISKYDDSGNHLWTRHLGTAYYDYGRGVSVDGSGVIYVSGYSESTTFSNDSTRYAFVAKIAVPEPGAASLALIYALGCFGYRKSTLQLRKL